MKHILLACSIALATPAHADPQTFDNAVRVATVPGLTLSSEQRKAYKSYRSKRTYFGAFYIAEGTDHAFWTRDFHDFDVAKAAAKKGCEIVAEGAPCKLYALLYPAGIDPNARGVKGMGHSASKDIKGRFVREQKKGKFGAFALNKAYGWGISFGAPSAAEAKAAALEYCKIASIKALAPLGIEVRKWAKSRGLDKCTVIEVHTPS